MYLGADACVCMYLGTDVCVCVCVCVCVFLGTDACVCVCVCIWVRMRMCVYLGMYACVCERIWGQIRVFACIWVRMCVFVCVCMRLFGYYIAVESEKQERGKHGNVGAKRKWWALAQHPHSLQVNGRQSPRVKTGR